MGWLTPTELEKWASPLALSNPQMHLGLPALDGRSRELYERALPRGVRTPRFVADRPPVNYWMPPYQFAQYAFLPGQIILGKLGGNFLAISMTARRLRSPARAPAKHRPCLSPTFIFIRVRCWS
jgi:hypothetical protein